MMDGGDRVMYDEMREAFHGEKIERDGIRIKVEAVVTADDDPTDDDARYSLDVRAVGSEDTESSQEATDE